MKLKEKQIVNRIICFFEGHKWTYIDKYNGSKLVLTIRKCARCPHKDRFNSDGVLIPKESGVVPR